MTQARIEIELHEQPRYNWKDLKCSNCGFKGTLAIHKKVKVIDAECPKCEIVALIQI